MVVLYHGSSPSQRELAASAFCTVKCTWLRRSPRRKPGSSVSRGTGHVVPGMETAREDQRRTAAGRLRARQGLAVREGEKGEAAMKHRRRRRNAAVEQKPASAVKERRQGVVS